MKIIVLYGDDEKGLYARLSKFINVAKKRSWEVSFLDDSFGTLQENLNSTSLFGAERFFILKDISKLTKKELFWINKKYKNLSGNLIIYQEGNIPQALLKELPKDTKVEEFRLPVILWSFLDGIYPGNSQKSVIQLHKVLEKQAPEFIFGLIAKLFRDLYWVSEDSSGLPYPTWRVGKLKTQASKYKKEQLSEIINELSVIDIKSKTSKSDLINELDLLLLKQLE